MHARFSLKMLEDSTMISTSTGSWIRSRRRRDRILLPVNVEIIVAFSNIFMTKVVEGGVSTLLVEGP